MCLNVIILPTTWCIFLWSASFF